MKIRANTMIRLIDRSMNVPYLALSGDYGTHDDDVINKTYFGTKNLFKTNCADIITTFDVLKALFSRNIDLCPSDA